MTSNNVQTNMNEITATKNGNIFCDLSHLGLLEISGADAAIFLQGQVSNDALMLNGSNAHFSAYCNPKGRMLALFLAFALHNLELGHHLHLQFNRELLEPIMKRLKMYVMRSKVDIKDVSDSIIKFGINGPQAASLLAGSFASIPTQDYQLVTLDNGAILKLPTIAGHTRFQIFTDNTNAPIILDALKADCQQVNQACWNWLDIQMGIPDVSLKTQEQFVPQMLNIDLLGGINFKKGCYTGQEIVARTHYLGSVKRRTYLASIQSNSATNIPPLAGDKVLDTMQNEVGQIVRVAPNNTNGFDALIELRIEAKEVGNLTCNEDAIRLKDLPYALL
jgi:tRNA-modifying protein YgfZ